MAFPDLMSKSWVWGVVGFLAGMAVFGLMPSSWLFISEEEHAHHGGEKENEVWACPMLCVKLDGPGTCPVCGMDLEKLEDTGDALVLNERERRLIHLETSPVERQVLSRELRSFGKLTFNQRRVERISAWVPGRITRLFADTLYTDVRVGDHLFEIYSPELFAAQTEYLAARRRGSGGLEASAREKLLLFGLSEAQIAELDASGEAHHTTIINAPASGTIFELARREGDYVKEGTPIYTIADYSTLWLLFDAYESDLPWIAQGQAVDVTLDAWPGRVFEGTVEFIEKAVDERSRTVKVRVVLDNPNWALKPGMFANVRIHATLGADGRALKPGLEGRYTCYMHPEVRLDQPGKCPICGMPVELHADSGEDAVPQGPPKLLSIPRSAVLDTGERQLVYVMTTPPQWEQRGEDWVEIAGAEYEARAVKLGPRAGEHVAVVQGLKEGERVVTRGNFLIDSQLELLGKPSLLHPEGSAAPTDPHAGH